MHVLVIGGTGNISREIVRSLLERGHEVSIVTRGQRPIPDGVRSVVADRAQPEAFEAALRAVSPDVVIDMIAYRLEQTEVAARAFEGRVRQFIHCSTVMTYGPPIPVLFADESCPLGARTDYGVNKAKIDRWLLQRHQNHGFPVTIVRPSYTFGEGNNVHRQVGDDGRWISRLRRGLPMLGCGNGDNLFQMLPTRDAGDFFALLVGREATYGQVYNMVHPTPMMWDDWHRLVMRAVGQEVEIVHAPKALLLDIDPQRFGILEQNFGYTQSFSGAKAHRDLPEWGPRTNRLEWIATCLESMDRRGLITDQDAAGDALEDRVIAALKRIKLEVVGT